MKKAALLLLALAVLGGAVFADDLAYTLTGSATLTWGYDLNTEAHGFTNTATAKLVVPLVAKQASAHGEDPITGWIEIKDFSAGLTAAGHKAVPGITGSAGTVTAKILFPNDLYIKIYSAPGFAIANAEMQSPISGGAGWGYDAVGPEIASHGGFTFGMDSDFSFAIKLGSTNGHGASSENDYHIGIDASYTLEDLGTFGANFIFGNFQADAKTMALGLFADLAFMEDALTVYLGTDFDLTEDAKALDLQFDLGYTLEDLVAANLGAYMAKGLEDGDADNPLLNLVFGVDLLAVENLSLGAKVSVIDLLDVTEAKAGVIMGFGVDLSYTAELDEGYLMPYASLGMILENKDRGQDGITTLNLGVEAKFFPLTTFTLDFAAGEIDEDSLFSGTTMGEDGDKGVITFTTKITY